MSHCWSSGLDLKEVDRGLWNKEYSRHERKRISLSENTRYKHHNRSICRSTF